MQTYFVRFLAGAVLFWITGTGAAFGSILTLNANTGAWGFQLEPGDAFVASAPPFNQQVRWGAGSTFNNVNFDFNAAYGPDFSGGNPNFSGTAQANLLTTGNEVTGFEMIGPWAWDVTIVFFEITFAYEFNTGFTGPANGTFNNTIGGSVEQLTVNTIPVPEPTSVALLLGAAGLLAWRRRA